MLNWTNLDRALSAKLNYLVNSWELIILFPVDLENWIFNLFEGCQSIYGIVRVTGVAETHDVGTTPTGTYETLFCGVRMPQNHEMFNYCLEHFHLSTN